MFKKISLASILGFLSINAFAVPVDVTSLTTAVDYSSVSTAILAVGAISVTVYVVWKAAKMVVAAVKGL